MYTQLLATQLHASGTMLTVLTISPWLHAPALDAVSSSYAGWGDIPGGVPPWAAAAAAVPAPTSLPGGCPWLPLQLVPLPHVPHQQQCLQCRLSSWPLATARPQAALWCTHATSERLAARAALLLPRRAHHAPALALGPTWHASGKGRNKACM